MDLNNLKKMSYVLMAGSALALYGVYKKPGLIIPLGALAIFLLRKNAIQKPLILDAVMLPHDPLTCPECAVINERQKINDFKFNYFKDPLNKSEFNLRSWQ